MAREYYTGKLFNTYLNSEAAWEIIEYKAMGYDKDIDVLYPEHFKIEQKHTDYKQFLDTLLLPKEQYHIFDDKLDNYILTSNGRIINAKTNTQVFVYFKQHCIVCHIRNIKIDLTTEFMKYGWSFNIDDIRRTYDKYKWRYQWKGIRHHYKK